MAKNDPLGNSGSLAMMVKMVRMSGRSRVAGRLDPTVLLHIVI